MTDCADLRDALKAGSPLTDALGEHAEKCAGCADLLGSDAALGRALAGLEEQPAPDVAALRAGVEARVARETGVGAWVSSRATPTRLLYAIALPLAIAVWVLLAKARPDLTEYPLGRLAAIVIAYSLLVGSAARHGLAPLFRAAPSPWVRPALIAGLLALPVVVAVLPTAHVAHPASLEGAGGDLARRALACFGFGVALAVPVLALWALLDREKHGTSRLAALAAAGAGVTGALCLELHCPITHSPHLLLGHATVALALAAIYTGLRRALASRPS